MKYIGCQFVVNHVFRFDISYKYIPITNSINGVQMDY